MARSKPLDNSRNATRLPVIILTVATISCLLPFIGKAFNIDDPVYVWVAQHIRSHPFDPYGFKVNWYGWSMPLSQIMKNPPLSCYYMALASCFVGWREVGMHVFFLVPAVACVLGTYRLAQRMCSNPLLASLAALFTPVFLVSSTTVMCDVFMLAFWVWAMVLWMEGLDRDSGAKLMLAAILVGACALSKYYGMTLVPLLLLYSLFRKRKLGWWAAYLCVPVIMLGLYQWATQMLYGRGLLLDAAAYATAKGFKSGGAISSKLLTGLAFGGGCLVSVLFYAPLLWSRRGLLIGVGLTAATAFVLARLGALGSLSLTDAAGGLRYAAIAQISIYAIGGVSLIVLALSDAAKHRDADSVLLLAWVVATFTFASVINWSVTARAILPVVPVAGILMMRRVELRGRPVGKGRFEWTIVPLIPAAIFSMWVAYADYSLANASGTMAAEVISRYGGDGTTVHLEGHWGFQYYMKAAGAVDMDSKRSSLARGDVVALPMNNANVVPLPSEVFRPRGIVEAPISCGLTTMCSAMGAGYYSDRFGPLPFAIGPVPSAQVRIYEAAANMRIVNERIHADLVIPRR